MIDKINRNETEMLLSVSNTRAYNILNEMIKEDIMQKENIGKNTYYVLKSI